MNLNSDRVRAVIAAIVAVLAGVGVTVVVVDNGGDHGPTRPRGSVSIHIGPTTKVDNADQDAKPNDVVELSKPAQAVAKDFVADRADLRGPLRGPGGGPVAKLLPPFAADEIPGCRTRFLRTNWSQRSVPPSGVLLFWLHYTGGPDIPGSRADVDGLTAFGNQPSAGVSWHLNVDKDGECDYNVPLRYKAWTEAGANSSGISVEVAGTGSAPYLRAGGVRQLRRILDVVHRRYPRITIRLGGVSNCRPTSPGIVTHYMGGPCSGGHTDIHPLSLTSVIAQLRAVGRRTVSHAGVVWCRSLTVYRQRVRAHARTTAAERSAARRRKALLARHRYACSTAGVASPA